MITLIFINGRITVTILEGTVLQYKNTINVKYELKKKPGNPIFIIDFHCTYLFIETFSILRMWYTGRVME